MVEVNKNSEPRGIVQQFKADTNVDVGDGFRHGYIDHIGEYSSNSVKVTVSDASHVQVGEDTLTSFAEAGWVVVDIEFEYGHFILEQVE